MPDQDEREHLRNRVREVLRALQSTPLGGREEIAADLRFSPVEIQRLHDSIEDSFRFYELARVLESANDWRAKLQVEINRTKGDHSELLRVLRNFGLTSDRPRQARSKHAWIWFIYVELLTVEGPVYLRPWSEVLSAAMNPLDDKQGRPMISYDLTEGPAHTEPWAGGLYYVVPGGEGRIVEAPVDVARAVEILQEHLGKSHGAMIKALERAAKFVTQAREELAARGLDEARLTEMFGSRDIRVPDTWPRESKP